MIVTAALAWFDEPCWQLEECVRGLATVADRVVAVDGRYARYEAPFDVSPQEQVDVIRETAAACGMEADVYVPDDGPWAGQVAKRSFLMCHAAQNTDWFMAADADHIWTGPRDEIRAELEATSPDVDGLLVKMFTPANPDRPIEQSAAGKWHADHAGKWLSPQRIFRSLPNVRAERFHWWYSGEKNGKRIWLWGGDKTRQYAAMREMRAPMVVEHRCLFREPLQIERNRAFCEDRIAIVAETGQEDDLRVGAAARPAGRGGRVNAVASYWSSHQVHQFGDDVTEAESLEVLQARFDEYPGARDLLPCDHQGVVLDYGCGPGHDTIAFLLGGAQHVYAADISWHGLSMLHRRLASHRLEGRCTLMLVPENGFWEAPPVDYVHCAGVLHHVSDPVAALTRMRAALRGDGEIRLMVYDADSSLYRDECHGDPEAFRRISDGGAPIAHAWTQEHVQAMCSEAGLAAEWLGSYGARDPRYANISSVFRLEAAA